MAQYIDIHNNWESARFHCPACGAVIFDERGEPTPNPCKHLLFSWIDEVGDFYNPADEVKQILEEDDILPFDDETLEKFPETTVIFRLVSFGMACGPVSITVIHAINFLDEEDTDSSYFCNPPGA